MEWKWRIRWIVCGNHVKSLIQRDVEIVLAWTLNWSCWGETGSRISQHKWSGIRIYCVNSWLIMSCWVHIFLYTLLSIRRPQAHIGIVHVYTVSYCDIGTLSNQCIVNDSLLFRIVINLKRTSRLILGNETGLNIVIVQLLVPVAKTDVSIFT